MRKKISSRSAINGAMENMGLEGRTNLIPMFKLWATRAEKLIIGPGMITQAKPKNVVLTVENCSAELCCDAVSIKAIVLGNQGCDCDTLMDRVAAFYYDIHFMNSVLVSGPTYYVIDSSAMQRTAIAYSVQDNQIVFNCSDLDGKETTVGMLVTETDSDGFTMINEGHIEPVESFLEWRWMKRARHKATERRYTKGEIDEQYMEWRRYAAYANGEDGRAEPFQEKQLAEMVHDQYSGLHGRAINSFFYNI